MSGASQTSAIDNKASDGSKKTVSLKGMTKAERKAYKKKVKEENQAKRELKVSKYVKNNRKGQARKHRQKLAGGSAGAKRTPKIQLNDAEEERLAQQLDHAEKELAHFASKDIKKGIRQSGKVEKSTRATTEQVIDQHTMQVLFKWMADGFLDEMGGPIRSGKEACAYHARGNISRMRASGGKKGQDLRVGVEAILAMREKEKATAAAGGVQQTDEHLLKESGEVVVKIFKTTMSEFKNRAEYVEGDHRFKDTSFGKQTNQLKLCKLWAEKEFKNLSRMYAAGITCPEPLKLKDHLFVMQFIGQDSSGTPAPQLREVSLSAKRLEEAYINLASQMYKIHQDCRLVHGDLSEYNTLYYKKKVWVIDVGQAVQLTHPHATKFLYRDIKNVTDFFCNRGIGRVLTYNQLYEFLVKQLPDHRQWAEQQKKDTASDLNNASKSSLADGETNNASIDKRQRRSGGDVHDTPLDYVRTKFLEVLEASGDNTINKYKGVDDISERGIDIHARVFGSGWKSDMQIRMNAGGNADTLDQQQAMEDLSLHAFGLEHMAAEITASERSNAADLVQRHEDIEANEDKAPRIHKKDVVKEDEAWFIKFNDLKIGMRARVFNSESRAVQECRKCTVRSSGASTMFWGTKTEKELLRKTGLGKVVTVKELDKSDRSVRVQFQHNGKQTWYPAALMTVLRDSSGNAVPQIEDEMPDFLEDVDGSKISLKDTGESDEMESGKANKVDTSNEDSVENERLEELMATKAKLESAISELEGERSKLPGKKNKSARQKFSKKINKLTRELEEVDFDIELIQKDSDDSEDEMDDDEDAYQEMVDTLAVLEEDLANTTKKRDRRDIKEKIRFLKREIEAFDSYRALEVRQAELEEMIHHGDGDKVALQQELNDVNEQMENLEQEMMHDTAD